MINKKLTSSFRDPSGFLFLHNGILYRQVNSIYKDNYDKLIKSGLYKVLVDKGLLIPHEEAELENPEQDNVYKIIKPELIPFISYPYEWCFSQLKDAAMLTLRIQKEAMNFGMSLKDCSSYNVQFRQGKPIFIDSLSFEQFHEGKPWIAYRQFCQHFLAPLVLMVCRDIRLSQLLRIYIDGIPLDLTSSLLPVRACFRFSIFSHIFLHSKSQKHFADKSYNISDRKMSRLSFVGLIDNLESAIKRLKWKPIKTEWADYYQETNYSQNALEDKKRIVDEFIQEIKPKIVWDLGSNTGMFSRIASDKGIRTISFDIDPVAVERNYLTCVAQKDVSLLPLLLDITNPSPGIGWENVERISLFERGPSETVFALALIHHLAISNNLPLAMIAGFFNKICEKSLIIEFIPKNDLQVQRLLSTREDIFTDYTQKHFENEFKKYFTIKHIVNIIDSKRTMYLMEKVKK